MVKILIGCPTFEGYDYCLKDYLAGVKRIAYKDTDLLLVDNSKTDAYTKKIDSLGVKAIHIDWVDNVYERIAASRNILRDEVLSNGYDYLLSLEQDVVPPPSILDRLISHNKKVVSGIYYKLYPVPVREPDGRIRMKKALLPLIFKPDADPEKMHIFYPTEVEKEQLLKIRACGLGCVLIHRDVLEKIRFRAEQGKDTFDDFLFCIDAVNSGFDLYADTSVKCKHLILRKGNVFK